MIKDDLTLDGVRHSSVKFIGAAAELTGADAYAESCLFCYDLYGKQAASRVWMRKADNLLVGRRG